MGGMEKFTLILMIIMMAAVGAVIVTGSIVFIYYLVGLMA